MLYLLGKKKKSNVCFQVCFQTPGNIFFCIHSLPAQTLEMAAKWSWNTWCNWVCRAHLCWISLIFRLLWKHVEM